MTSMKTKFNIWISLYVRKIKHCKPESHLCFSQNSGFGADHYICNHRTDYIYNFPLCAFEYIVHGIGFRGKVNILGLLSHKNDIKIILFSLCWFLSLLFIRYSHIFAFYCCFVYVVDVFWSVSCLFHQKIKNEGEKKKNHFLSPRKTVCCNFATLTYLRFTTIIYLTGAGMLFKIVQAVAYEILPSPIHYHFVLFGILPIYRLAFHFLILQLPRTSNSVNETLRFILFYYRLLSVETKKKKLKFQATRHTYKTAMYSMHGVHIFFRSFSAAIAKSRDIKSKW